jgi:tetratricopeptide (TPR) repeat protein/TolB-like protein
MVRRGSIEYFFVFLVICLFFPSPVLSADAGSQTPPRPPATASAHGIYLVFPFQNTGASSQLDWLSEGLEELTIQGLSGAGEQVYSHSGRLRELERNGIPATAKLSRATMLHVAEDLDADFVVFGSYSSDGKNLAVECRLLRVNPAGLLPVLEESGGLNSLMDLHARLTWRMLAENDRAYPLNLAEFTKTHRTIRLDAFEHYIRGLMANDDEARLRELREAARLEPEWPESGFALGEAYFTRRDCNSAMPWYARVPKTHDRYAESLFSIGVCRLLMNQPDHAEEVFTTLQNLFRAGIASGLDFPEILNNLAIAKSRQNKIPAAQEDLRRAAALDPDEDDYPFNLGLIAVKQGDFNGAAVLFREASQREPDIPEDRALLISTLERAGEKEEAEQERISASEAFGPNGLPAARVDARADSLTRFERVKTELDPETLRFEMESAEAHAVASGTVESHDTPASHLRRARQELSGGKLDAAEREYRAVLTEDKNNAAAHFGLAEIARRQNKLDDTVKELQASLQARDSATVRITLARVYLEQKKISLARAEAERALTLAPNYAEAKRLLEHLPSLKPAEGSPKGGPQ